MPIDKEATVVWKVGWSELERFNLTVGSCGGDLFGFAGGLTVVTPIADVLLLLLLLLVDVRLMNGSSSPDIRARL